MDDTRTPWFEGEILPARPGVYERELPGEGLVKFSRWDGKQWCKFDSHISIAADQIDKSYILTHHARWRGLAKEPK
jgi:hypothetical protein